MDDEFDRLRAEVVAGTATEEQRCHFNQMLRESLELREHVAEQLLDDSMLVEELRTRGLADSLRNASVFPTSVFRQSELRDSYRWNFVVATVTAVGVVAISAFLWWTVSRVNRIGERTTVENVIPIEKSDREDAGDAKLIGTIVESKGCQWEPRLLDGQKVTNKRYRLKVGSARIMMANGIELIVDANGSPADFEIRSQRQATLFSGQLVASVHPDEIGFVIETPTTKVVDVGTKFAVAVDPDGSSRVEVLDGAVNCSPLQGEPHLNGSLFASGQATRFIDDSDRDGLKRAGDAERLRKLQESLRSDTKLIDEQLTASDDFSPRNGYDQATWHRHGWSGPWRYGSFNGKPTNLILADGPLRGIPAWLRTKSDSCLVQPNYSINHRVLTAPIDLSLDRDYYLSILMHKRVINAKYAKEHAGGGLSLFSLANGSREKGLGFSLDGTNRFSNWTGAQRYNAGRTGLAETTYFVVLKVAARAIEPDNLFLRAFEKDEVVDATEPKTWNAIGLPVDSNLKLDVVALWCGESVVTFFDELRLGTTWKSVATVR